MIKIEKTSYGYKSTFSGIITLSEIENELAASQELLANSPEKFVVLVDLRNMELLPVKCQKIMYEGQTLFKAMGMERSVIIVRDKLTAMQFKLLGHKAGLSKTERYINTSLNPNWEKEAMDWLLHSVEPSREEELVK